MNIKECHVILDQSQRGISYVHLCKNTKTVYQYGKNVLYFFYNIAQRTLTEEWREIFRVEIELYKHVS